ILCDRGPEHGRILRDEPQPRPQVRWFHVANINAIERDASGLWVVEPQKQIEYGTLSCSRRSDERNRFTGTYFQAEVLKRCGAWPSWVIERHVLETEGTARRTR